MSLVIHNYYFAWSPNNNKIIRYCHYDLYNNLIVLIAVKDGNFLFNFVQDPDKDMRYVITLTGTHCLTNLWAKVVHVILDEKDTTIELLAVTGENSDEITFSRTGENSGKFNVNRFGHDGNKTLASIEIIDLFSLRILIKELLAEVKAIC